MVFLRRICSSRPGDGEQRGQSLAALTARGRGLDCLQPQPRQPVLRRNKLRIFRFRACTEAKDTHLASTRSSRAPCAFPNLRCYPRCWLFSCLGLWSHPHISPKEHQKERCGHFSAAALLHYVLWCASDYSIVGRISYYVSYDSIGTNVCQ